MTPRRKLSAFRPVSESFTRITWAEPNRLAHEAKRPFPPWALAHRADWSRVMKRKDTEHPGPPARFQALVRLDLADRTFILFGILENQYGVGVATEHESEAYFRHYA